jgi:hypothetical protein
MWPLFHRLPEEEWSALVSDVLKNDVPPQLRPPRVSDHSTPQIIEPIRIYVDDEVVGMLFLRSKWMQDQLAKYGQKKQKRSPKVVTKRARVWHMLLKADLDHVLRRNAAFLPVALASGLLDDSGYWNEWNAESLEPVLKFVEESSLETSEWTGHPVALQVIRFLSTDGSNAQRKRARAILRTWLGVRRGRVPKDRGETRDEQIFGQVCAAEEELREGWNLMRAHGKNASISPESLRQVCKSEDVVRILLNNLTRGNKHRHRKLRGIATALVAERLGQPAESVDVRSRRGENRLRALDLP